MKKWSLISLIKIINGFSLNDDCKISCEKSKEESGLKANWIAKIKKNFQHVKMMHCLHKATILYKIFSSTRCRNQFGHIQIISVSISKYAAFDCMLYLQKKIFLISINFINHSRAVVSSNSVKLTSFVAKQNKMDTSVPCKPSKVMLQ